MKNIWIQVLYMKLCEEKNLEYWANKAKSLDEREDQIQTKTELGLDFMTIKGL